MRRLGFPAVLQGAVTVAFLVTAGGSLATTPPTVTGATIQVNASQIVRVIPRTLYGANLEWTMNADQTWDYSQDWFNSSDVTSAIQFGIGQFRFPGGVYADYYNWHNGVGSRATRPTNTPDGWDRGRYPNPVGTDEVIALSRLAGAELPMFQTAIVAPVNLPAGTTPAQLAAQWVSYCNAPGNTQRAANGSVQPYGVKYWEIGNEPYYQTKGEMTVAQYSSTLQSFATAMKAVDPTIKIGAVSSPHPAVAGWNQSLVQSAAHSIDFIAVHDAYAPVFANSVSVKGASFDQVYQAIMAFPLTIASNLHAMESQVSQYASAADAARIRFAVTEWGPLFSQGPNSNWYDHTRTLGSALFVASTLETFIRDTRLDAASFFKFADPLEMGMKSDAGIAKASGYVFQMFTQHFGNTLVSSSVQSATYNSVATGNIPATAGVPYLDVVSSLSADSSTLYLIVVNKNMQAAMQARISLGGFVPAGSATTWTLTAPSIDANNGNDIDATVAAQMGVYVVPQITAPVGSMFTSGTASTVVIHKGSQSGIGTAFTRNFPPMSITAIEIARGN